MELKQVLGFFLLPLVLLLAAYMIEPLTLWSTLAQHTVPWFLTAVAIAVAIVGIAGLLCRSGPGSIPPLPAILVWLGVMLILGGGLVVDYLAYAPDDAASGAPQYAASYAGPGFDWQASAGEWVGFGIILAGALWLPRQGMEKE